MLMKIIMMTMGILFKKKKKKTKKPKRSEQNKQKTRSLTLLKCFKIDVFLVVVVVVVRFSFFAQVRDNCVAVCLMAVIVVVSECVSE